ncbi:MAG: hypothetical protein GX144_11755 [Clostridiaceae bacterium]|nr:hypothetical protein [Clostridiaceae bacterium]
MDTKAKLIGQRPVNELMPAMALTIDLETSHRYGYNGMGQRQIHSSTKSTFIHGGTEDVQL